MKDITVTLVGSPRLVRAWSTAFADTPVPVTHGDILVTAYGHALVSPANSFGWMDGGLDAAISLAYATQGLDITARVQAAIRMEAAGELPVGAALIVPTPEGPYSHLVVAPTMRTPRPVPWTLHAYLAFRATLLTVRAWNSAHPDQPVQALDCPGLATGIGHMPGRRAARQMRAAWDQVERDPATTPPLATLTVQEYRLRHG